MTPLSDDGPYVIWSMEHQAWWCPNRIGYSTAFTHAGWYSYAEALAIVQKANLVRCHEAMIPISALLSEHPLPAQTAARIRPATSISLEVIAKLRAAVVDGAVHECNEWLDAQAYCVLCGRKGEGPPP